MIHNPENKILEIIEGHQGPIRRKALARATGFNDRINRDIIAELQAKGYRIANLNKGYLLATEDEWRRYIARERKRAISILTKLKGAIPEASKMVSQLELFQL